VPLGKLWGVTKARKSYERGKMKKSVILLMTIVIVASLAIVGCAKAPAPAEPEYEPVMTEWGLELNPYEGLAVKPDGSPYFFAHAPFFLGVDFMVNAEGIMESLITRAGADYVTFDPGFDVESQIGYVEDLIAVKHPDAIIMSPVDEHMLAPVCEQAMAAGIDVYVWAFDLKTEVGKGTFCNVCRDWEVGGSDMIGQYFVDYAESTGEHLNILELWGMRSQDLDQERHCGFRCPVDQCDLCTVIETPDCQWSDELAASLVTDAFTAHPELNALYAHGGGGSGAIEGLRAIGRLVPPGNPDHVITAFNDCDTLTVETLDAGNLDAFGTHQSWDLCDVVVKLAFTHTILGQPIPGKIDVPMKVITRDNIDTEEGSVLGAPVYPRMPVGQWDIWPVLDTSLGVSPGLVGPDGNYVEIETPTKALRMELQGY